MKRISQLVVFFAAMFAAAGVANAGKYADTISLFKNAGESATFFKTAMAMPYFPTSVREGWWWEVRSAEAACTSRGSSSAIRP